MQINREALRALRERGGDSRETLAERCDGLSAEAIRLIENGVTTNPRPGTVKKLAVALGVPVGALTAGLRAAEETAA